MLRTLFLLPAFFFLFVIALFAQPVTEASLSGSGYGGMVVSVHPLASEAGIQVLKDGGNAIDAAVAVGLALQSVHPSAGNIGGGGFAVIRLADGQLFTLDFRETAPGASHALLFMPDSMVERQASVFGALSVGIPGTVRGLEALRHRFGTFPWDRLIEHAIHLAQSHPLTPSGARQLNTSRESLSRYPETASIYVKDPATGWTAGDTLYQPDLVETLKRLQRSGPEEFYIGETARLILRTMNAHGGIMTATDLAGYQPVWREPLVIPYRGAEVVTMSLPSSGGIILAQTLHQLSVTHPDSFRWENPVFVHQLLTAWQLAYADRSAWLGDPGFVRVPVDTLLSHAYWKRRWDSAERSHHISSDLVAPGVIQGYETGETTHFGVMDSLGNAVSVTYTLNGGFGSCLVVEGAGFLLNNEMDDFATRPGIGNLYGLIGSRANAIAPGKRMLSSMTPVILLRNGAPWLVAGGPGGSRIPTGVCQVLINTIHLGLTPYEAVNRPRIHYQWKPDEVILEPGALPDSVILYLKERGWQVADPQPFVYGRTKLIRQDAGVFSGSADHRGGGTASPVMSNKGN